MVIKRAARKCKSTPLLLLTQCLVSPAPVNAIGKGSVILINAHHLYGVGGVKVGAEYAEMVVHAGGCC